MPCERSILQAARSRSSSTGTRRLLGTLSDGDIRRGLLRGLDLHRPGHGGNAHGTHMCRCGRRIVARSSPRMRRLGIHQIPLRRRRGVVRRARGTSTISCAGSHASNWVVLMAGGLGVGCTELTRDTPKPMLKIGNRPLLETIVRSFADQGFRQLLPRRQLQGRADRRPFRRRQCAERRDPLPARGTAPRHRWRAQPAAGAPPTSRCW